MKTKDDILDALEALFGDTTASLETTLEEMEEIRDRAQEKIELLKGDLKRR